MVFLAKFPDSDVPTETVDNTFEDIYVTVPLLPATNQKISRRQSDSGKNRKILKVFLDEINGSKWERYKQENADRIYQVSCIGLHRLYTQSLYIRIVSIHC